MDNFILKTYSRKIANKFVDAELYSNPAQPNDVGILVRASNGSKLSSQEIIDVISDLLLVHYSSDLNDTVVN